MEPFLGQIIMFGGNFAPRGWALCDGQLLSISQNSALFSILGTTYGGDGRTTFGLPDLRGRVPMHAGRGPGLTDRHLGQKAGTETNTITTNQMPAHSHTAAPNLAAVGQLGAFDGPGDESSPSASNVLASIANGYSSEEADTTIGGVKPAPVHGDLNIAHTGGGHPVDNVQPFQCVNFIIALQGIFPSRN